VNVFDILLHSYLRWFIVGFLILNLLFIYHGFFTNKRFSKIDKYLVSTTVSLVHTQFLVGLFVFINSPIIALFFQNFSSHMKNEELRFFGIEHTITMILAIVLITIGSYLCRREKLDNLKFKKLLVYFSLAFVLIMISIPWEFSPYIQRPLFR